MVLVFMASRVTTRVSAFTAAPSLTSIDSTIPASGLTTSPGPVTGREAPAAVAGATDTLAVWLGSAGALRIVPRTRLADALGDAEPFVNSRHHQAVSRVEQGLLVSARAGDGMIEALEHESQPFCIGVQWHPEKLSGSARASLFEALVDAC